MLKFYVFLVSLVSVALLAYGLINQDWEAGFGLVLLMTSAILWIGVLTNSALPKGL